MKKTAIFILCIILFQSIGFARSLSEFQMDYSRLVELIKMRDKEEPLYIFNKFEDNLYDSSCKTAVEYLNAHPGIVKKLRSDLNGRIILGEVGSCSSFITFMDNGGFKFTRNNFTVWQNSAENPYTALMTPVEKTLHILLRENAERMIKEKIDRIPVKNMQNVQNIADEWISVEEAVVGGLVYVLFPDFAKQYLRNLPVSLIDEDIETKYSFFKYKYLKKGISLVKSLGYEEAIRMYR